MADVIPEIMARLDALEAWQQDEQAKEASALAASTGTLAAATTDTGAGTKTVPDANTGTGTFTPAAVNTATTDTTGAATSDAGAAEAR